MKRPSALPLSLDPMQRRLLGWEREFGAWLHRASASRWVVRSLALVSRLGDGWIWLGFFLLLPLVDELAGTRCSVRMLAVGALNLLLYKIVKRGVARPRPCRACDDIRECVPSLDEYSFPSGHTLHAVSFALIIAAYFPALAIVVWAFAAAVALSRMVLGLHYLSDVAVGAAIGAITAGVSFNLL